MRQQLILVTGFARGGTSWLRDCIDFHPDVDRIPHEQVVRDDARSPAAIARFFSEAVETLQSPKPYVVNKAPANAPLTRAIAEAMPDVKMLFIIRDPRDVFISHKRGTKKWMGGKNSTVSGCMAKTRSYYEGYLAARQLPNVMLVSYESLHQDFHRTMAKVYDFIGLPYDHALLEANFKANNFVAAAGRRTEDRADARRKGVVGDWSLYLEPKERRFFEQDPFWCDFFRTHGYTWEMPTHRGILSAMREAGVRFLDLDAVLNRDLDPQRVNVLLLHDIDDLNRAEARASVLKTAEIEHELGAPSIFNFLPLDDTRYRKAGESGVLKIIAGIKERHPRAEIALHLNAAERFFPADAEDADDSHPRMRDAVRYLHEQVQAYARHGIKLRFATAHGYGRAKKRPNNRDSELLTRELQTLGIPLWDNVLRGPLDEKATHVTAFHDVGGPLAIRGMPSAHPPHSVQAYRDFPPGGLIRYLSHPGNYDIERTLSLGLRFNRSPRDPVMAVD